MIAVHAAHSAHKVFHFDTFVWSVLLHNNINNIHEKIFPFWLSAVFFFLNSAEKS